jgi:hypothetical protein
VIDYVKILQRRYQGKQWWIQENDYATLDWLDDSPKPSKATLDGLWASVQTEIADETSAKQAARQAVLDKLGLTADEAQALLG